MTLKEAISILRVAGIENPSHDARELFVHIGGISRTELILADAECNSPELEAAVIRRSRREPLQYIIGSVDFYRESYKVTPDCLIPRQDTEILVDYAVKNIPCGKSFIDLCTGSGCVAISTLKNTEDTLATALDISTAALRVAKENAERNGVLDRIDFVCEDAFSYIPPNNFFAILSNPPYVEESVYETLEPEIFFEPKIAFVAKDSGLEFYKTIISGYKERLEPCGFFAFEIGFDQGSALCEIAKEQGMSCDIIKDYSGNDRLAVIKTK